MQPEQVLAFRLARSGLARRSAESLGEAAACPCSDFSRGAALLALGARLEGLTRQRYDEAVDHAEVVVAHSVRGAIHALAPTGFALYGRALISSRDGELALQLGQQVQRLAAEKRFAPSDALGEVAEATRAALRHRGALGKNELHDELRARVGSDLMPWCSGCKSHHVAPMLWRYASAKAGARLDSSRRYVLGMPTGRPAGATALKGFLRFYGPATAADFCEWAGVVRPHAERLWKRLEADLCEVSIGTRRCWLLSEDMNALESPPDAAGIRLIPPGDPYLQKPNRPLLAPERELRKRLFRPPASPGAVLENGRLAGLWRVRSRGRKAELTVDKLARLARADLEEEAQRVADLQGASELRLVVE